MDPAPLDPSLWNQFGPFAVVFVVMTTLGGGAIAWLLRDRLRERAEHQAEIAELKKEHDDERARLKAEYDADIQAHRDQLDLERKENRALADRLVASAERTAPVLERAAQALELVTRMGSQR